MNPTESKEVLKIVQDADDRVVEYSDLLHESNIDILEMAGESEQLVHDNQMLFDVVKYIRNVVELVRSDKVIDSDAINAIEDIIPKCYL